MSEITHKKELIAATVRADVNMVEVTYADYFMVGDVVRASEQSTVAYDLSPATFAVVDGKLSASGHYKEGTRLKINLDGSEYEVNVPYSGYIDVGGLFVEAIGREDVTYDIAEHEDGHLIEFLKVDSTSGSHSPISVVNVDGSVVLADVVPDEIKSILKRASE